MNKLYKNYIEKFETAKNISQKYSLDTSKSDNYMAEINGFKVTVPIVGGFSTGKSTLLNFMLGQELLSTNITPETAIPAEITYGDESVIFNTNNQEVKKSLNELSSSSLRADTTSLIKINLKNSFLQEIPTVKIVDMPGFDSGYELHNRAINDYLPNSMAYIITVAADEGTLKESIINFINELKLNNMPVYIVITKTDKILPNDVDDVCRHIDNIVRNQLKLNSVKIIKTSAADEENIEELKDIFRELQSKSDEIFRKHFATRLYSVLSETNTYLTSLLNKRDSSSDAIINDKERLEEGIIALQSEFEREKEKFSTQADRCIESIKNKVSSDLSNSSSTLETIILQGNDISEKINTIVRNSVTTGISQNFEPKLQQYAKNINEIICNNIINVNTNGELLSSGVVSDNMELKESLKTMIAPVSAIVGTIATAALSGTAIAATLGAFLGPIGAIVGGVVGTLIGSAINKSSREKEDAQRREAAKAKVSEVIRDVSSNIGMKIEATVFEIIGNVNENLEKSINEKIEIQKKAIADAEEKLKLNEIERQAEFDNISNDNKIISDLMKEEEQFINE